MPSNPDYSFAGSNPLSPDQITPADRRAELCALLARGLIRLRMRNAAQLSAHTGESSLHKPAKQSGTAEPTHRRTA